MFLSGLCISPIGVQTGGARRSFAPAPPLGFPSGIFILAIPPFWEFLSKLKNREEFVGGLEKWKGKEGREEKMKRVLKHTLKYLYET